MELRSLFVKGLGIIASRQTAVVSRVSLIELLIQYRGILGLLKLKPRVLLAFKPSMCLSGCWGSSMPSQFYVKQV